jgi:hypothetical protein
MPQVSQVARGECGVAACGVAHPAIIGAAPWTLKSIHENERSSPRMIIPETDA